VLERLREGWIQSRVFRDSYKPRSIAGLQEMHTYTPRLPFAFDPFVSHVSLSPSQTVSDRFTQQTGTPPGPTNRLFHFRNSPMPESDTLPGSENTFDRVLKVARPLYRCYLSCKAAFPSSFQKDEWMAVVWSDACERTGGYSGPSPAPDWASPVFC
jgi:hypothetical protein